MENQKAERQIRCNCGKWLASEKDGHILIKCRGCGHIIDVTALVEEMNQKKVLKKY